MRLLQALTTGKDRAGNMLRSHLDILDLRVALVKDFARIHWQNLVNFGILPITFVNEDDYHKLNEGDILEFSNVRSKIKEGNEFEIKVQGSNDYIKVRHALTARQVEIILVGGMINWVKDQKQPTS